MKVNRCCLALVAGVLVANVGLAAEPVVKKGATWKYFDGKEMPKDWHKTDFDDKSWKKGAAPLGYGERAAKTTLSFGKDPEGKNLVALFRAEVDVKKPEDFEKFCGRIRCDDGAVVFVNGEEVARINVAAGRITGKKTAASAIGPDGPTEEIYRIFFVDADKFKAGKNTISVSVHQAYPSSSDLLMDMQLDGLTKEEVEKAKKELKAQDPLPQAQPQQRGAPAELI